MNDHATPGYPSSPVQATPSPHSDFSAQAVGTALGAWALGKRWLEVLVFQATNLRRDLSDSELEVVYDMLEVECGLKESSLLPTPAVRPVASTTPGFQTLSLRELSDVSNVNALVAGQRLIFHEQLTIFFGENGCGKSGYARVLKRIAGARGAEELIPNVFLPNPGPPKAKVSYKLDQCEQTLSWDNDSGIDPLSAMQVFDDRAAAIHLDEDLAYSYTPRELDSFDYVQDALERIRERLESDVRLIRQAVTGFVNTLKPGSMVFRVATANDIKDHAAHAKDVGSLLESEISDLHALPQDIEAMRSGSVAAEIRLRRQGVRLLEAIATQLEKITTFDSAQYALALAELQESIIVERSVSSGAFVGMKIPKLLEPSWRAFIVAGETYIRHANLDDYPDESQCIYCLQPLQQAAMELVRKYRGFCNSTAQEAIGRANGRLAEIAKPLTEIDSSPFGEAVAQLEMGDNALLSRSVNLFENLKSSREKVSHNEAVEIEGTVSEANKLSSTLRLEIARIEKTIAELSEQESGRLDSVGKSAKRLAELTERSTLGSFVGKLQEYDANVERYTKAEVELANCTSYQRALTITAKEVSERLLNESFEARFKDECKILNAPDVRLAFPGRRGKVIRQKGVGAGYKLSMVLSEGEQKVIALADFLAELSLRPQKVPVVFDDPVTSLDYGRIRDVSRRIAALSGQTQVVLFTHNIMLVAALLDAIDVKSFVYYDVRRAGQPGYVSIGTNPRIDSFSKLKTRINSAIEVARKQSGAEEQRQQVELIYDHMRSACEVLVEQELLKKLTERYLPNLKMTVLAKIKYDRLQVAAEVALEVFEKACRFIPGHSQPIETLSVFPTLEEVERDWAKLQKAKADYDS
jgi:energy-coupling factor transporter ATP-binding protein EcfA2